MTDTVFADVSEYQPPIDDTYPYRFISFRSNDGTYRDGKFQANLAWAKKAVAAGKLDGFIVYFVFEPNWQETVATFKAMVGQPHRKMAVMIDVESWSGRMSGNYSAQINACRRDLMRWLGSFMPLTARAAKLHRRRVIGYGNAHDLQAMWPVRHDTQIVLASYGTNPDFPGKIAHQFDDKFLVPPFGKCDINSADGVTPVQFAKALGLRWRAKPVQPTVNKPTDRWAWIAQLVNKWSHH